MKDRKKNISKLGCQALGNLYRTPKQRVVAKYPDAYCEYVGGTLFLFRILKAKCKTNTGMSCREAWENAAKTLR